MSDMMNIKLVTDITQNMLVAILVVLTVNVVNGKIMRATSCKMNIEAVHTPSFFSINNQPLESAASKIKITEESESNCFINLNEVVQEMALPSYPMLEDLLLQCNDHKRVFFTEYDGQKAKHVIFRVVIDFCTIDMDNLNNLLNIGDTRVLQIVGILERGKEENVQVKQKDALKDIVSFAYFTKHTGMQNITTVFKNKSSYPNLAEIALSGMNFDVFPIGLKEILPNLQSLELPENDLNLPPEIFPWTKDSVLLPRNLSRSPFMQSDYSASKYIEIPDNVFRRYLNLDGNEIKNLSNYMFHGNIDKVSIKRNGLHTIGNNTFRNILRLQYLDLRNNVIAGIPIDSFKGMACLQKLLLGENQIKILLTGIFDDQISLEFLDLANNSLKTLPVGVFAKLQKLEILRLEHNEFYVINPYSLPLDSVYLKEIHFQFNPIIDLPHFPFYIRSLRLASFHGTQISLKNLNAFLNRFDYVKLLFALVNSESNTKLRKIDLSDCNITTIKMTEHSLSIARILKTLLLKFEFVLTNNPIICDCEINSILNFIQEKVKTSNIHESQYLFNNWTCQAPPDFNGRKVLSIKPEETYCEVSVLGCPQECKCYERATVKYIIVDCRHNKLTSIHRYLPNGKLELWYSQNNITNICSFPTPENVIVLDVSENKIETINGEVIKRMKSLEVLCLNSNVLAYIPQEITTLNLEEVNLVPNPLTCDCKTLWMKNWLKNNKRVVKDWDKVACKIEHEDGMVLTYVPDDKFVCDEDLDVIDKVVLPSVTCSVLTLSLVILFIMSYAYRLECKVLMFVYFGIHPFDRDWHKTDEHLDCVIVHSGLQTDWVEEKILPLLENKYYGFVVCDMARDFVIGFSFQENLSRAVRHSKRMIFCLSEDWNTSSDTFTTAWRIAQEKIKNTRSHYGIIVSHAINKSDVQDKDLRRFIERGRFVDSKDRLFGNKIVYYMPQLSKMKTELPYTVHFRKVDSHISKCFINNYCGHDDDVGPDRQGQCENLQALEEIGINAKNHVFISYHDNDFQYVLKELLPFLEEKGFSYCIADRDFVPGVSVQENILNAIDRSYRTIFILSSSHVEDEWSLFTFRAAYEKALREKSNHLLVIVKEDVEDKDLDEEIRYYLKNYICLNVNDRWFEKKLCNGLPLLRNRQDLHTSALLLRRGGVNEADVTIEVY